MNVNLNICIEVKRYVKVRKNCNLMPECFGGVEYGAGSATNVGVSVQEVR